LKKRREFLAVQRGLRNPRRAFILETLAQGEAVEAGAAEAGPRFGFTVTKKVGNAVVRNRIRRRLREAVRLGAEPAPGFDHVLVGRRAALGLAFTELCADLAGALAAAEAGKGAERPSGGRPPRKRA
jgi:ribonuclease P protein component